MEQTKYKELKKNDQITTYPTTLPPNCFVLPFLARDGNENLLILNFPLFLHMPFIQIPDLSDKDLDAPISVWHSYSDEDRHVKKYLRELKSSFLSSPLVSKAGTKNLKNRLNTSVREIYKCIKSKDI